MTKYHQWGRLETTGFISHSSRGWKAKVGVPTALGEVVHASLYPHAAEAARDPLGAAFIRALILFIRLHPQDFPTPKGPTS